jgi:hypothetical protein
MDQREEEEGQHCTDPMKSLLGGRVETKVQGKWAAELASDFRHALCSTCDLAERTVCLLASASPLDETCPLQMAGDFSIKISIVLETPPDSNYCLAEQVDEPMLLSVLLVQA